MNKKTFFFLFLIAFIQVYKKYGRELCVVVTNVNHMAVEYCHPKTTPHMPVRLSLRMSMSIPGMFTPPRYGVGKGEEKCYVDGGLLCNYPIHSFDGKRSSDFYSLLCKILHVYLFKFTGKKFFLFFFFFFFFFFF